MKQIATNFFRGLGVVLPVVLTLWLVVWLAASTEALLRPVFLLVLPDNWYIPGSGIALALVGVYAVGVMMQVFVVQHLWHGIEALLNRLPLVKTVYNAVSDFFGFFSTNVADQASRVASIDLGDERQLLGFVTDEHVRLSGSDQELIALYLPMSYQIGGYTILLPPEQVRMLDMGAEEALRFILTAGINRKSEG